MKLKPQIIIELALASLVLLGLLFALGSLRAGPPAAAVETPAAGTEPYPPPVTETPIATFTREPTPTYAESTPMGEIPPTETGFPTFTPFPSPTLRPGPSNTPVPTIGPAEDASGSLIYLAAMADKSTHMFRLEMGPEGNVTSPPDQIRDDLPKADLYPSPSGERVAIVGSWGLGLIFDHATGQVNPFSEILRSELFYNWFPDNRQVLLRTDTNNILLAEPESGKYTPLAVPGIGSVHGAAASPDGSKVVYSYSLNEDHELWIVNADGRDAQLLLKLPGSVFVLAWSPDGTKIACFGAGLMVMDADGTNLRTIGKHGTAVGYLLPPVWSPDSRTLAMVSSESVYSFADGWDNKVFEGTNIYLVDVASGEERTILPDGSTGNIDPAWSPDGQHIAFISNRGGAIEVWAIHVDGSNLRAITSDGLYKRFPFWRRGQ